MKLTFIGAAHEVTGSCTLLECCGRNFLIDYGMEQGVNVFENVPLPVLPGQVDAVFLTHAHKLRLVPAETPTQKFLLPAPAGLPPSS